MAISVIFPNVAAVPVVSTSMIAYIFRFDSQYESLSFDRFQSRGRFLEANRKYDGCIVFDLESENFSLNGVRKSMKAGISENR